MRIITLASQKGGAGKTTLTRNLAVAAQAAGLKVGLIDTDPQGSLSAWYDRREAETPLLVTLDGDLDAAVAGLRGAGCGLVIIDTPPSTHPIIKAAMVAADLVCVPVRPSPDDLDAVGPTLDLIDEAGRGFAFVISLARAGTNLLADTYPALAQHGRIAPTVVIDRQDYPKAARDGLGVTELAKSAAADEMTALWTWIAGVLEGKR